jgi:hypothetical protein
MNSIRKSNLALIVFFVISIQLFSQSRLEKYWFYCNRLSYFVHPGEGIGESLIVDIRNPNQTKDLRVGD